MKLKKVPGIKLIIFYAYFEFSVCIHIAPIAVRIINIIIKELLIKFVTLNNTERIIQINDAAAKAFPVSFVVNNNLTKVMKKTAPSIAGKSKLLTNPLLQTNT